MPCLTPSGGETSRLALLLEHFARVEDPRDVRRVTHPLAEVLLLVVCGTMADCDDYDHIAAWGETHLEVLRRHLPHADGVPGGRWLTILMNRINPALFGAAFTAWVREAWPDRPEFVAIDGKTSRRSHDRASGAEPLHLVSAFATTARLVLGQQAVSDKSNEITAIPVLLARLAEQDGLKGALVSIDAMATNATIAQAIRAAGADYLLAVKDNRPTPRAEVEAAFAAAPPGTLKTSTDVDKGHGRIETRSVSILHEVDWLSGQRRFPGELRLPDAACLIRVAATTERGAKTTAETRYYIASARLRPPHRRTRRRRRPRTLEHREPPALGARRRLPRGPVAPAKGTRRQEHGRRPTLRTQPRPRRKGQAFHQAPTQTRRMEPRIPQ